MSESPSAGSPSPSGIASPPAGEAAAPARVPRRRPGPGHRRVRIRPGTFPGTLMPAGPDGVRARLTLIAFDRDRVHEAPVATVDEAVSAIPAGAVAWLNVDGLDPVTLAALGRQWGLHPLALEDAMDVPQRPKVERYDKHVFMVLRTLRLDPPPLLAIEEEQVSVFFGDRWIITVQEREGGDCFEPVRDAIRQGRGRIREAGADYLAYLLLDAVVDAYFPVLESLDDRMHALESAALEHAGGDTLRELQRLRHDLLAVRRAVWPVREEIGVLQRDESRLIAAETHVFLRDAYDHALLALEVVETLRDTSTTVMEVYLSVQNQRLNEVMKVLTVIATLFIPLTFIASIYGMNFQFMPELHWRYGYPYALGLMALTATAMVLYFKRRGWW
jgi:magnesium transporter